MKRKLSIYTIIVTALLLSGCSQNNAGEAENNSATNTATPTASAEATQETTQSQSDNTATGNTVTDNNAMQDSGTVTNNHPSQNNNASQDNNSEASMISEEEAKQIALSHAGLSNDQVTFIKSGLDRDHGRLNYDIEFYSQDQTEYDYEIDPYTGEVLDYDHDAEYYGQTSDSPEGERISEADAKQIALAKVEGATEQDIRKFKSEYDNGRLEYEGKIYYGNQEFEFEIDGYTGEILEWDVETIYGAQAATSESATQ